MDFDFLAKSVGKLYLQAEYEKDQLQKQIQAQSEQLAQSHVRINDLENRLCRQPSEK